MKSIINELKAWRSRWRPREETEETEKTINRAFAATFAAGDGKTVLDYLIETYMKPIEFLGAGDSIKLAERNGQQLMLVDILSRYDRGMHPGAFEPDYSSKDEERMDVRIVTTEDVRQ